MNKNLIPILIIVCIIASMSCKKETGSVNKTDPIDTTKVLPIDTITFPYDYISATVKGVEYKWEFLERFRGFDTTSTDLYHNHIVEGRDSTYMSVFNLIRFGISKENIKVGTYDLVDSKSWFQIGEYVGNSYSGGRSSEHYLNKMNWGYGQFTISEIDSEYGKITGSFSVTAFQTPNDSIVITDGIFHTVGF